MKEFGGFLMMLGGAFVIFALVTTTSAHVAYTPSFSAYAPSMPTEVANLEGLHVQALWFQAAFTSFICGTIALGFGLLIDATKRNGNADVAPVAQQTPTPIPAFNDPETERTTRVIMLVVFLALLSVLGVLWALSLARNSTPQQDSANIQATSDAVNAMLNSSNAVVEQSRRHR